MRRRAVLALVAAAALAGPAGAGAATPPARAGALPRVSAPAAILIEASTGRPVFARRADEERAIASTTKIMTALLTLERRSPGAKITVPPYAAAPAESQIGLRAGERLTVADLLTGLLLPSANDAANALAVRIGGTRARFVRLMNLQARQLGLRRTHFTTPVGLDTPGNYSTARELAKLAIVLRRRPFARATMDEPRAVLRSGAHRRVVLNRNTLVRRVPWVDGVKTGHTLRAGYVLVGSARRNGVSFVSVVLGTRSEAARDADSLALLSYGVRTFRVTVPVRRGALLRRPLVKGRDGLRAPVVASRTIRRLIRRSRKVTVTVVVPKRLEGPLPRRSVVGRVVVRAGGRVVGTAQALTARAVPAPSVTQQAWTWLSRPTTLIGLGGVLLAAFLLIRSRRAAQRRRRREPRPKTA